jgi:DNA-binding winged helix-turn-helix (wHTH) protein
MASEPETTVQYLFQDQILDTDRRELTRGAERIALGPQVFDLLVYLLRNREHVVSKDDLLDSVWNGRIVSESTLTSHINAARKALGDSGEEQRLIRTVARKGFRFIGEVKEQQTPPREHEAAAGTQSLPASSGDAPKPAPALALPNKPSIAVLPFQNLSGSLAYTLAVRYRQQFELRIQGSHC